jgi:hypothetical protein
MEILKSNYNWQAKQTMTYYPIFAPLVW